MANKGSFGFQFRSRDDRQADVVVVGEGASSIEALAVIRLYYPYALWDLDRVYCL